MARIGKATVLALAAIVALGTTAANVFAADASTIPVGTVITKQNWQQYRQFMTQSLQHTFESTNIATQAPTGTELQVGPTKEYSVGHWFWDATEKYSKQVKLVKAPKGSYSIEGYVAGMPFPEIKDSDPLAGYKVMFDIFYRYEPAISSNDHFQVIDTDRYLNVSFLHAFCVGLKWDAIVDPGYPLTQPNANGLLQTFECEQMDPEQIKYVTALNDAWKDPNRFPESYVFLPSLRRALRLSSASRCAPFQGQDFSNDDPFPLPPIWFQVKYDGVKHYLHYMYSPEPKPLEMAIQRSNFYGKFGQFLFPKPGMGHWQVENYYQIEMSRLPQYARGYCYGNRMLYLNKEGQYLPGYDTWDQNMKYWRGEIYHDAPLKKPDGAYYTTVWTHCAVDFQNDHTSCLQPPLLGRKGVYIDQEAPPRIANYQRYGTPAGLQQIMQ